MVGIMIDGELWRIARSHLDGRAEEIGFFLADWTSSERCFVVRTWRPIHDERVTVGGQLHVSLSDETRAVVIKWAAAEDACLIEAHSHGPWGPAAFSAFDLRGLEEWVPHLRWRLHGRPYAAMVTTTDDFDALAWIDNPRVAEQVTGVSEDVFLPATGATLLCKPEGTDG